MHRWCALLIVLPLAVAAPPPVPRGRDVESAQAQHERALAPRDPRDRAVIQDTVERLCFHCIKACLRGTGPCEKCIRGCVPMSIIAGQLQPET